MSILNVTRAWAILYLFYLCTCSLNDSYSSKYLAGHFDFRSFKYRCIGLRTKTSADEFARRTFSISPSFYGSSDKIAYLQRFNWTYWEFLYFMIKCAIFFIRLNKCAMDFFYFICLCASGAQRDKLDFSISRSFSGVIFTLRRPISNSRQDIPTVHAADLIRGEGGSLIVKYLYGRIMFWKVRVWRNYVINMNWN